MSRAVLAIAAAVLLAADAACALTVRVALLRPSPDAPTIVSGDALQYRHTSGQWAAFNGNSIAVNAEPSQVPADASVPLRLRAQAGPLKVSQGETNWTYSGVLEVMRTRPLQLVNELDLEDYLVCVVPSEMPSSFPEEALKAQAVAARSYTMAGLGKHRELTADLCDTTCCQAYRGGSAATERATSATRATSGQYLTTGSKPLYAQYSACCGGFSKLNPALGPESAHPDTDESGRAYCSDARYFSWEYRLPQADLLKAAGEERVTPVRKLKVVSRDVSGRIEKLEMEHDFGVAELSGAAFRDKIGTSKIRGLRCSFKADPATGDLVVEGSGWGHGIGLCQYGARGMALAGKDYKEILLHYYPGASLVSVKAAQTQ